MKAILLFPHGSALFSPHVQVWTRGPDRQTHDSSCHGASAPRSHAFSLSVCFKVSFNMVDYLSMRGTNLARTHTHSDSQPKQASLDLSPLEMRVTDIHAWLCCCCAEWDYVAFFSFPDTNVCLLRRCSFIIAHIINILIALYFGSSGNSGIWLSTH